MKIKECLENISKSELNKILAYNNFTEWDIANDYDIRKLLGKLKMNLPRLEEADFKILKNIINNKEVKKMSKVLTASGYVFKINEKYVVSEEIKTYLENTGFDAKKVFINNQIIIFYIFANGVLKLDKLLALAKKSGYAGTEEDVVDIFLYGDLIDLQNRMVFYNNYAKSIYEQDVKFRKAVNAPLDKYVIFNSDDMTSAYGTYSKFIKKSVEELLKSANIDGEGIDVLSSYFSCLLLYQEPDAKKIDKILKTTNYKLPNEVKKHLLLILKFSSSLMPKWLLNGGNYDNKDSLQNHILESLQDMIKKLKVLGENKTTASYTEFVRAYVEINGAVTIDKLMELLGQSNCYVDKKTVLDYINSDSEYSIYKGYINLTNNYEYLLDKVIEKKEKLSEYKVISNPSELLDKVDAIFDKINILKAEFKLTEEMIDYLTENLFPFGITADGFDMALKDNNVVMSDGVKKRYLEELKVITEELPVWIYNGYSEKEFKKLNKKSKK